MKCRHCGSDLALNLVDLGFAPPSNAYLTEGDLSRPERSLPLRVSVCQTCWLAQTEDFAEREDLFSADYAYFSSTSRSWLEHSKKFCDAITKQLDLDSSSFVVEIASNDGYLLRNFLKKSVPCLGVEPTLETAKVAQNLGVEVVTKFFGSALADEIVGSHPRADLIIGNNVFAHVPDVNDFSMGMKKLLNSHGTITLEFPHLLSLIRDCQFDTIYHEHYSYFSLSTVDRIFLSVGLKIYDVEKLATHGGSLRVYGCHADDARGITPRVGVVKMEERNFGLEQTEIYSGFQKRAISIRNSFTKFLIAKQENGETVVGFGAAAKGNTLLNFAGIKKDLLPVVFDSAPSKQGKWIPGAHIPIENPLNFGRFSVDCALILPWNLASELKPLINEVGGERVEKWVALPKLRRLTV